MRNAAERFFWTFSDHLPDLGIGNADQHTVAAGASPYRRDPRDGRKPLLASLARCCAKREGQPMNYLLSILITAVVASQAMIWHSLATIRDAIQQTNAIALAACGTDRRPCQVAAQRGQIELGEIMVRTRVSDGFSCGYSQFSPCWIKASGEDGLVGP
jgi:hypothetical protein